MSWLKEQLQFTRMEILGLVGIISIGMMGMVIQFIPENEHQTYDLQLSDVMVDEQLSELVSSVETKPTFTKPEKAQPKIFKQKVEKEKVRHEIFDFDPNHISVDSLLLLGFKKYQAERWVKFRKAGKNFANVGDILSIYGIDTSLVLKINEQLQFPKIKQKVSSTETNQLVSTIKKEVNYKVKVERVLESFDLNACTEEDLKKLRGIGPKYASRIIKYRSILGGYSDLDQLLEVYGMTDSTYWLIKEQLKIETPPALIRINTVSKDQLADHYLISYKLAKLIFAYREEHGPFVSQDDFKALKGLQRDEINKILPYLDFAL